MGVFFRLCKEEKPMRIRLIMAFLFVGIGIGLSTALPLTLKYIIDCFENSKSFHLIFFALILYGVAWILSEIAPVLKDIFIFPVIENGTRKLSVDFMAHLNKLSVCFHVNRKTGNLMSAIERAQIAIPMLFYDFVFTLLATFVELTIAAIVLCRLYDFTYSVIFLCIFIAFVIFNFLTTRKISYYRSISNSHHRNVANILMEFLFNFEVIRYFGRQEYEVNVYDKSFKEKSDAESKNLLFLELSRIGQSLILGIGLITLSIMAGNDILNGSKKISDFVFINALTLQVLSPLSSFGSLLRRIYKTFTDIDYISNILNMPPEIQDVSNAEYLESNTSEIVFKNVTFGYKDGPIILNDISFVVPAGKTVAIVGLSGSGKSTITKLLYRFYDVLSGEILIGGRNIKNVHKSSIIDKLGIVSQEALLFNNSIAYNIGYSKLDATQKEIEAAAAAAQIDKLVHSLPDKYNTMIGERGLKLSGGEKQRISIARLLVKNPAIYIFDEATSSLDVKTEKTIQATITRITKNKTTFIISHRLSTIMYADNILFLKDGKIEESGTHQELINKDGHYANLWKAQTANIS